MSKRRLQPESLVKREIFNFLASLDIFAWNNQSVGIFDPTRKIFLKQNSPYSIKGTSDIFGFYLGKFFAIEVKAHNGVVSKEQKAFIEKVKKCGNFATVAYSVNDVKDLLAQIQVATALKTPDQVQ